MDWRLHEHCGQYSKVFVQTVNSVLRQTSCTEVNYITYSRSRKSERKLEYVHETTELETHRAFLNNMIQCTRYKELGQPVSMMLHVLWPGRLLSLFVVWLSFLKSWCC